MSRSKSRIAAIMLSALACSANNANTRALSTAGTVFTTLAAILGAAEIYNEVSAVVRKKQGKELNWWNGKLSVYNLLSNSERKQKLTLTENQKVVIRAMFKGFVNDGDEDDTQKRFKTFFENEMLLKTDKKAQENFEIFKQFLDGKVQAKCEYSSDAIKIFLEAKTFLVALIDGKVKVVCDMRVVLEEG